MMITTSFLEFFVQCPSCPHGGVYTTTTSSDDRSSTHCTRCGRGMEDEEIERRVNQGYLVPVVRFSCVQCGHLNRIHLSLTEARYRSNGAVVSCFCHPIDSEICCRKCQAKWLVYPVPEGKPIFFMPIEGHHNSWTIGYPSSPQKKTLLKFLAPVIRFLHRINYTSHWFFATCVVVQFFFWFCIILLTGSLFIFSG